MSIREKIIEYINREDYKAMTKEELAKSFGIEISDYRDFFSILTSLERENQITVSSKGKYKKIDKDLYKLGKISGNASGFAFFIADDENEEDVFIAAKDLKGAMDGDRVQIKIINEGQADKKREGAVIKILSGDAEVVGTFIKEGKYAFVNPINSKISRDIFIAKKDMGGAKDFDKVVVKITKRAEGQQNPEGVVKEIIGSSTDKGIEITAIARQFNFRYDFPEKVIKEAESFGDEVSKEELEGRVDFTNLTTVTIDGASAKDFDDAISIEKKNDDYNVYVHIADVSHYVKKGSALDKEARERGNSIYLLDRVIPMLPESLSNNLCSLNPGKIRLVNTVRMTIDGSGNVKDYDFYKAFISSDRRLIYEDVSDFLESGKSGVVDDVEKMLVAAREVYKALKDNRVRRGALDFMQAETEFVFDENKEVLDIKQAERRIANKIIEELMIVTNETVSQHFGYMEVPFLYRIHESPSREKIAAFKKVMATLGYLIKGNELFAKDLQLILDKVKGKKEELLVCALLLRSMAKAVYSEEHDEHFALASKYYSHFTAPIRRYADLVIHRVFSDFVINGGITNSLLDSEEELRLIAQHISDTERRAEEAEREVEKILKCRYMHEHLGDEYEGIISSLTNFGFFVQLENTVEGLVSFNLLRDDYYFFDEANYVIIGERTNRRFSLGDKVKVRVIGVDMSRYEIDFELLKW